nr:homocysteine S-methyltransferase family protein [Maliibacterium massiliense]
MTAKSKREAFRARLAQGVFVLDGAFGTVLQQQGLPLGQNPTLLNISEPARIADVHARYIQAGCDAITLNTFSASAPKLAGTGLGVAQAARAAMDCARAAIARTQKEVLVAYDIGPCGELLQPMGTLSLEEMSAIYHEQAQAAALVGADFLLFETMTDLAELKAGILAARDCCDLPIVASMSVEADGRTFMGCAVENIALVLEGLGVEAMGFNCSVGPDQLLPMAKRLLALTSLPVIVQPNAGLPCDQDGCAAYDVDAEAFAAHMADFVRAGVRLVGGCCGTTPDYIAAMRRRIADVAIGVAPRDETPMLCSATRAVRLDQVRVIGERINPTGKKRFAQALRDGDMDYIVAQGVEQVARGAEILDVNVGVPGIDEPAVMAQVVDALQAVVNVPLQIDSTNPVAVEAGLRHCTGKAIVNSVNGEEAVLARILPIVKKYGAAVVGLTMDERGLPQTCAQRVEIARRIVARAADFGIPKRDVYIDCLTLTVSAEPAQVKETLDAVRQVRADLGVQTVLGVSNVSFGLPARVQINTAFLAMALEAGLTLPIMNPNIEAMMAMVRAYRVLAAQDAQGADYIAHYAAAAPQAQVKEAGGALALDDVIRRGLAGQAADAAARALETMPPLEVVERVIVPTLDAVGRDYEAGRAFLPQLIQSAQTVQKAFDVLRAAMAKAGSVPVHKGVIVLATVKGDVHDIGKNIVRVLLENYGYQVVDLGRDVPKEKIIEAVKRYDARLVGLSALMTTTVPSMRDAIESLRALDADIAVMVGGAVLTEEYARRIGAHYYGKDAAQAAAIAKKVLG